jgi:hypothetical protein
VCITNYDSSPTIIYNNIHNNSEYNIQLDEETGNHINASYNWWGTTDISAINQKIYDFKYDFNLGTVSFIPFLTEPNPQATPDTFVSTPVDVPSSSPPSPSPPSTPATTPTPYQEPQQTDQTEAIIGAAIAVAVIGAGLGLLIYLIKRK